jgi:hypothetical protein
VARAITAALVRRHARKRKAYWEVVVRYADSGAIKGRFRCPFQGPRYVGIRVRTLDAEHDGLADTVVLTAHQSKRAFTRFFPG